MDTGHKVTHVVNEVRFDNYVRREQLQALLKGQMPCRQMQHIASSCDPAILALRHGSQPAALRCSSQNCLSQIGLSQKLHFISAEQLHLLFKILNFISAFLSGAPEPHSGLHALTNTCT